MKNRFTFFSAIAMVLLVFLGSAFVVEDANDFSDQATFSLDQVAIDAILTGDPPTDDDDTPPDVHYEAGMGCIDCHGSPDMHGGTDSFSSYNGGCADCPSEMNTTRYSPSLIVHNPGHPGFVDAVAKYLSSHSYQAAASQGVDLSKLARVISR